MLAKKELGKAIAEAIRIKGVSKADVARHFGVKPPSITDWCNKGTISKDKLPELFAYFADIAGPQHWGLSAPLTAMEPPAPDYRSNVRKLKAATHPLIREMIAIMDDTDDTGKSMAIAAVRVALHGYKPAKANPAS